MGKLNTTRLTVTHNTGKVDAIHYPNGMTTAYDFYPVTGNANDDRLAEIHTTGPGGTISKFNYQYDPNGRISQWTQQQGGASALRNYAFAYDRSGQLTDTVVTDDSENVLKTWSWQYDPAGNRLRESVDTASTYNTFNELNQLDQIGGSGTTLVEGIVDDVARKRGDGAPKVCPKGCFWRVPSGRQEQQPAIVTVNDEQAAMFALPDGDYRFRRTVPVEEGSNTITVEAMDASENVATNVYTVQIGGVLKELEFDLNGNLRFERDSSGAVLREFQWDARNRLVKIIDGDNTTEFEYDGLDRRVRIVEKENNVEQSNVTFLWSGSEIIQKRAADAETILRNYFDDGFTEGTDNFYYTKDHLGSIREVVADDGVTIESRYEYTPWGVVTRTEGTGVESDFLYTGHLYHAESGLFLAQYRAYDPGTGRWLSRDPLGFVDGPNLYAYVGNDPINFWDPLGFSRFWRAVDRGLGVVEGGLSFAAGGADTATFGLTSRVSNRLNDAIYGEGTGDKVDCQLRNSRMHSAGQIAGIAIPGTAAAAGAARIAGPGSRLLGKGSGLFGKKGFTNSNDLVRFGWSSHRGTDTFRAVVGGFRTPLGRAISKRIPARWRHLDYDAPGLFTQGGLGVLGTTLNVLDNSGGGCE